MGPTDPKAVIGVLNNILGQEFSEGESFRYVLGEIYGLTPQLERKILEILDKEEVLKLKSVYPGGSISLSYPDEPTSEWSRSAAIELVGTSRRPQETYSVNRPPAAMLVVYKAKIKVELNRRQKDLRIPSLSPRYVEKDGNGNFLVRSNLLISKGKPLDHGTKHYLILDVLYTKGGQDGKVSLETMRKALAKKNACDADIDRSQLITLVDNALRNSLFRFGKIGADQFKNELPNGLPLISTNRKGKEVVGWQFNNPILT